MPPKRSSAVAAPTPATPTRGSEKMSPEVARSIVSDLSDYDRSQGMSLKATQKAIARLKAAKQR